MSSKNDISSWINTDGYNIKSLNVFDKINLRRQNKKDPFVSKSATKGFDTFKTSLGNGSWQTEEWNPEYNPYNITQEQARQQNQGLGSVYDKSDGTYAYGFEDGGRFPVFDGGGTTIEVSGLLPHWNKDNQIVQPESLTIISDNDGSFWYSPSSVAQGISKNIDTGVVDTVYSYIPRLFKFKLSTHIEGANAKGQDRKKYEKFKKLFEQKFKQ